MTTTKPTEKQFREEVIAAMVAQKKEEYRRQRWDSYHWQGMIGRSELRKKMKAVSALPFTDEERSVFNRLLATYNDSQRLVREIESADRDIKSTSSKASRAASYLSDLQENAQRFSNEFLEALPAIMELKILAEPTFDRYNDVFRFAEGSGGNYKSLTDYKRIAEQETEAQQFSQELAKWNEQLEQQQARRADLVVQLQKNCESLRAIISNELPPIYDGIQARFAERQAAVEKEMADFDKNLDKEFADLFDNSAS